MAKGPVGRFLGIVSAVVGLAMLPSALVAYRDGTGDLAALLLSAGAAVATGLALAPRLRVEGEILPRDGYLLVVLGWLLVSFWGALPYRIALGLPFVEAFFESASGFTTTGASVLPDVEAVPRGLLLWRATTHFLGGMGIIVLAVAILPALGTGGMRLFAAEAPGPEAERLRPRIASTARLLWGVYVLLVALEVLALWRFGSGMSLFDAVCHAFATVATGGFGTRNASLAAFSPLDQWIVIAFMFLAGCSFTLHYRALAGRPLAYLADGEFLLYAGTLLATGGLVSAFLWKDGLPAEAAFRHGYFQTVSLLTCTGFTTADYEAWRPGLVVFLFLCLFPGGCIGSTSGGIKQARIALFGKAIYRELVRLVHPRAVVAVRLRGREVAPELLAEAVQYVALYLATFAAGALFLALFGHDLATSLGAAAACLGGVGPGLGLAGPAKNYAALGAPAQWVLVALMIAGRLEIYTLLVVLAPHFWRR